MGLKKYGNLLYVSALTILVDQVSKWLVLENLHLYQSIPVIPGFFNLTHIHNPGGAFGMFAGQSQAVRSFIFILVSLAALVFIFYFYKNTPQTHTLLGVGFALIFGGAIGNLIDRLRFGKVVDFLDVYIRHLHWPAFNIADSAISIGMAIFVYHVIMKKMPDD